MAKDKTKKKKSSSDPTEGMSAKEKMMARKKKIAERGKGGVVFLKEGTTRVRLKSPGPTEEIAIEVIQFYLGKLGSVYSPATFGEPCALMEKYEELKKSDDEDDILMAKKLVPKRKYIVVGDIYADSKGKEVDKKDAAILIASGLYNDIIELYLDEDEWGDMTDLDEGYDLKLIRSGKGQMDTSYSVTPCSKSKIKDKERRKPIDMEEIVRGIIASYEETEEKLKEFLSGGIDDDDDDRPKKNKKGDRDKKSSKDSKKKKRSRDI